MNLKPLTPKEELEGQIEFFLDLKEELDKGNINEVIAAIDGAVKVLRREKNGVEA